MVLGKGKIRSGREKGKVKEDLVQKIKEGCVLCKGKIRSGREKGKMKEGLEQEIKEGCFNLSQLSFLHCCFLPVLAV